MTAAEVLDVAGKVLNVGLDTFTQRRRSSPFRAMAVRALLRYAGMSQREAAEALRIGSGAAVCNPLSRLDDRMAADRQLGRRVEEVERALASAWRARKTATSGEGVLDKCIVNGVLPESKNALRCATGALQTASFTIQKRF